MADAAQVNTFTNTYAPFATMAGASLGVSPSTILAQWALESGYGTSNLAVGQGNLAGLSTPGSNGASFQSFATPTAFEQAYVNTIESGFPASENTGTNLTAFVQGLGTGKSGSYFGTEAQSSYLGKLSGALANLETLAGVTPQSVPAVVPQAAPTGGGGGGGGQAGLPAVSQGAGATGGCAGGVSGLGGVFSWSCWQGIITDLAFVAIGVLIFIVAVGSGLFGSGVQQSPIARNVRRVLPI